MAHEDRHAHAGDGDLDVRVQHLVRLVRHLLLLVGRTVLEERADVGDDVEGDLFGELLGTRVAQAVDGLRLVPQLVHAFLAGAGHRLIGRDDHPLDPGRVMQRLQRRDQLDGRAVGVGDDVLLGGVLDGVGVHLGHDQRHVGVLAEGRGVVDHDGTGLADLFRPFPGHRAACGHQHQIDLGEVELFDVLAFDGLVAEGDLHALGLARGDGVDFIDGEFQLLEDVQHFAAHIARGSDDGDAITHFCWSFGRADAWPVGPSGLSAFWCGGWGLQIGVRSREAIAFHCAGL